MKLHIGKEIEQRYKESGIKLSEFAKRLNTSPRNVYAIFERSDIKTDLLRKIGEVLNFNFFTLYQDNPSMAADIDNFYASSRSKDVVYVMVTLDGNENTLNQWIKKLTLINKSIS